VWEDDEEGEKCLQFFPPREKKRAAIMGWMSIGGGFF